MPSASRSDLESLFVEAQALIDEKLTASDLPVVSNAVKGGYGPLSRLAAEILYQRTELSQLTDEKLPSIGRTIDYLRSKIDEVSSTISRGYPEISEPLIDANHSLHQHARQTAERFPIDDDLYESHERDVHDASVLKQLRESGTPQDQLLNRIYQRLTQRQPGALSCDVIPDNYGNEIERVVRDIEEHKDENQYAYEKIEAGHMGALQKMAILDDKILTVEPSDYVFPLQYKNAPLEKQSMRYYLTFQEKEAENVGLHFVRIMNMLLGRGVRIKSSKACSPFSMRHRMESMVILSNPEDGHVIHEALSAYDQQYNCFDDLYLATPFSSHRGIATAPQPSEKEKQFASFVHMRESSSFNGLYSSMIYYHVLQRLLNDTQVQGQVREIYQRELNRITPAYSQENSSSSE